MLRVFVDSSVLYAAFHSMTGFAYDLVVLASTERVKLIITPYVFDESYRALSRNRPEKVILFEDFVRIGAIEILSEADESLLIEVAQYVVAKDAPVVAAAVQGNVDYLVTYDRKHLLRDDVIEQSGLNICIPEVVVKAILGES